MIQFRAFGTIDLRADDGRELHSLLAQPKRIALLAYLCVAEPFGYHRRNALLALFWPDADQEHGRTSLRKSLHVLRHSLGEAAILSRGDEEVAVDLGRVDSDVASFKRLLASGHLEDALKLYGGDLLPGFFVSEAPDFERWLDSDRKALRQSAARAAYSLAEKFERSGDHLAAVSFARQSFDLAENDERALRKLISLQFDMGDRAKAIETYGAFALRLAAEYQTQPSAESRSLIERIRGEAGFTISQSQRSALARGGRGRAAASASLLATGNRQPGYPQLVSPRCLRFADCGSDDRRRGLGMDAPGAIEAGCPLRAGCRLSETIAKAKSSAGRLALSPDGSLLAYIGGRGKHLLIRPRNQLRAAQVPETDGAVTPFFSPDGSKVGFLREYKVEIASVDGGSPITVSDTLTGVAGASWGPDGFIYVDGSGWTSLMRVEAKAGAKPSWFTVLDTAGGEFDHTWPDVLPNGKGVLFTVSFKERNVVNGKTTFAIAVADIATGKHRVIVPDAMFARYSSSGHLLYVTPNKTFDDSSLRPGVDENHGQAGRRHGGYAAQFLRLGGSCGVGKRNTLYATGAGRGYL